MIEVIKEGDLEKLNPKHFCECKKCGCEFTYQREDVQGCQRYGDYVECPTCKTFVGI